MHYFIALACWVEKTPWQKQSIVSLVVYKYQSLFYVIVFNPPGKVVVSRSLNIMVLK
jgi:hypothetical protein